MVAVVALVLAVVAAVVTVVVATSGDGQPHPAAADSASASAATSPTASPSLTRPQIVTVTRSATLSAPAGGGAQGQPAPASPSQLRNAFDSAVPVDQSADQDPGVAFTSPSQNIECYIFVGGGDSVQCAIKQYYFPQPGPDCDYGAIVTIDADGNATYSGCATSDFTLSGDTLQYGSSITNGEFGCVSQEVGISCLDLDTNTGFTLSRQEFVPVN